MLSEERYLFIGKVNRARHIRMQIIDQGVAVMGCNIAQALPRQLECFPRRNGFHRAKVLHDAMRDAVSTGSRPEKRLVLPEELARAAGVEERKCMQNAIVARASVIGGIAKSMQILDGVCQLANDESRRPGKLYLRIEIWT
ncbi:hypothetical protein AQ853_31845 [Burkholderia pseudomallei]|nr:hypothetical protein AQ853_31845 [Burkholderia pseudomallei]